MVKLRKRLKAENKKEEDVTTAAAVRTENQDVSATPSKRLHTAKKKKGGLKSAPDDKNDEDDVNNGSNGAMDGGGIDALLRLRSLLAPPGSHETKETGAKPGPSNLTAEALPETSHENGDGEAVLDDDDDDNDEDDGDNDDDGVGNDDVTAEKSEQTQTMQQGPDWTSRYFVVNASDPPTPLEELRRPLHPIIERSLRKNGFQALLPIQAAVIPLLSHGADTAYDANSPYSCDVCVAAPTGQGKTLAYAVPIVQALLGRIQARPRALVILPTRDLAMQVFRVFEFLRNGLGKGVTQICAHCLIGQKSFAEEQRALKARPADIVVCTPGRLSDHFLGREGQLDLGALRWFVADEADRLLTQASHRWLDILERVSTKRGSTTRSASALVNPRTSAAPQLQKLLLSATMTWNPQKLAMLNLRRALFFISSQTGKYATPKELKQHWITCSGHAKPLAVLHLVSTLVPDSQDTKHSDCGGRVVMFCSSVDTAHRLARLLQILTLPSEGSANGVDKTKQKAKDHPETDQDDEEEDECGQQNGTESSFNLPDALRTAGAIAEFSSTLTQAERTSLLAKFRKATVKCLVCSDVIARGIDIPEVKAVINYSAPEHLPTYIHRVGRTARAGRSGQTFTFVQRPHMPQFEQMLRESADCWERIQEYQLPAHARDTKHPLYARSLKLLERCLHLEAKGLLPSGRPLRRGDLQAGAADAETPRPEEDAVGKDTPIREVDLEQYDGIGFATSHSSPVKSSAKKRDREENAEQNGNPGAKKVKRLKRIKAAATRLAGELDEPEEAMVDTPSSTLHKQSRGVKPAIEDRGSSRQPHRTMLEFLQAVSQHPKATRDA